ncbi:hypothetical protein AAG906_034103 [Vitis piasezkii]
MLVPRTIPICAAWTDDLMKKRVHVELHDYGDYGLADVQEDEREEDAHEDPGNPVNEVEEETTIQIHQLMRTMRGAIDKLAKRQNTNKTPSSSHQSRSHNQPDINDSFPSPPHAYGSPLNDRFADGEDNVGPSTSQPAAQHSIEDEVQMNAIIPYETRHPPIRSYRLRRHATALQSPYVVQPSIKFSASSSVAKQVLAYALDDTRDESQILCSMHNFFLTRFDLKCLGPDKLVDNKGSLSPKYICGNLWKYFKNTQLCTYEQLFILICRKNHWNLIILNIHVKRIELLDSLIVGRKKRMDAFIEKLVNVLSTVIGIQERRPSVDMTEFEFVVPEVVQQLNPTDCGIFVMKFMQLWSNGGISRAIANDKVISSGKTLTQLIMSPENEVGKMSTGLWIVDVVIFLVYSC